MTSADASTRSLRDEQVELTRARVLDAVAELIAEEGVFDFTVQQVADRAGVSHRTIYRHFPDRTALLDGLSARLDEILADRYGYADLRTPDDMVGGLDATWQLFEAEHELLEALVIASVGAGTSLPRRRERTREFRTALASCLEHLDPSEADAVMAVLRSLGSSTTWFSMRRDHDVDMPHARAAVIWAMEVLTEALAAGARPSPVIEPSQVS